MNPYTDTKLVPCPFCQKGKADIRPQYMWTGQRNNLISATVQHWCERAEGQLQSFLQIKGKTIEEAVDRWNTRYALASVGGGPLPAAPAGEEKVDES